MNLSVYFVIFLKNDKKGCAWQTAISIYLTFLLKLCSDVLLEVFCFGDRRRISALERIGRRIYHIVEFFIPIKPFHRVNLIFQPAGYLNS